MFCRRMLRVAPATYMGTWNLWVVCERVLLLVIFGEVKRDECLVAMPGWQETLWRNSGIAFVADFVDCLSGWACVGEPLWYVTFVVLVTCVVCALVASLCLSGPFDDLFYFWIKHLFCCIHFSGFVPHFLTFLLLEFSWYLVTFFLLLFICIFRISRTCQIEGECWECNRARLGMLKYSIKWTLLI